MHTRWTTQQSQDASYDVETVVTVNRLARGIADRTHSEGVDQQREVNKMFQYSGKLSGRTQGIDAHNVYKGVIEIAPFPFAITADLKRRTLNLSMKLNAPSNKKRVTAPINWLLRQLKNVERGDLLLRAVWPRRVSDTSATISGVRDDPATLVHDGVKEVPQSLEVIRVIDLAGKFSGVRTFVEYASSEVPVFYKDVGEYLRAWVPPPPKIKRTSALESIQDSQAITSSARTDEIDKASVADRAIARKNLPMRIDQDK